MTNLRPIIIFRRMSPTGYLLISPCRDEARFMRQTLDTVIAQSIRPRKWIIVDDGSTDETPSILAEYKSKHDWIDVITRSNRTNRSVGPGVIDAFYAGLDTVDFDQFEFLCKLDLDLRLPPRYFEILMARMNANPQIATCSGKAYLEEHGQLVNERHGDDTSIGATKFYRTACFRKIGGFVREVMWDGIDCHRCRMNGWIACSWDDPDLRFVHLRPMGSSQNSIYSGRFRHGFGQYFMGTGFTYMLASSVNRLNQKPYVLGSAATMFGWLHAWATRKRRYDEPGFRNFLRKYQWQVLLRGKSGALRQTLSHKDASVFADK